MQFWKRWFLAQRHRHSLSQQRLSAPASKSSTPTDTEEARLALTHLFGAWELRRNHPFFKTSLPSGERASGLSQETGLTLERALYQISALGPLVVEPLLEVLRAATGGPQAFERARLAALALGRMGTLGAVPALLEALRDQRDGSAPLRAAAARALGQMQAEAAARLAASESAPLPGADRSLEGEALRRYPLEQVVGALVEALRDPAPQVRAASAAAFLELLLDGFPEAAPLPDTTLDAAPTAAPPGALSRAALRSAVDALSEALKDPEATVRLSAMTSLGWLGDAHAAGALADALSDSDERCRSAAALALGMLGTPAALKPLARALADPGSMVRQSAAEALGQLANPVATDLLLDVLHDGEETLEVRAAVARALGRMRVPQVVLPLRRLLEAPEPLLRAAAIEAFGTLGFGRAYRLLVPFLWRDPDRAVRHSAARALARLAGGRKRSTRWRLRLALRVERQVRQEALLLVGQDRP